MRYIFLLVHICYLRSQFLIKVIVIFYYMQRINNGIYQMSLS